MNTIVHTLEGYNSLLTNEKGRNFVMSIIVQRRRNNKSKFKIDF